MHPGPVDNLASALSTITTFLNQLTESLGAFGQQFQNQGAQSQYSFSYGFQLQVVGTLIDQMDSSSAEEAHSGHALAASTIENVAMKIDAKVDSMA